MRVNRTLLYAGIFLVAIGGVVVAADLTAVSRDVLVAALRLWPLAIIAIEIGLVLKRTPAALGGGLVAVAVTGLLVGSAFAAAPRVSGFCTTNGDAPRATQSGTFSGPANVSVTTNCGALNVAMVPGSTWRLDAPTGGHRDAVVRSTDRSLAIESASRDSGFDLGRQDWDLALPTGGLDSLSVTLNAGRGDLDLAGATIPRVSIAANAAELILDASEGNVSTLAGELNIGQIRLLLGAASDMTGTFDVNLGELMICAPDDLGLRISSSGDAHELKVDGTAVDADSWQSPGYASASHHVNLEVNVDLGSVEINPIGGCK